MSISIIVARVSRGHYTAHEGMMPWGHIKDDLKRFRKLTMGNAIVTDLETMIGISKSSPKLLPGRSIYVLTEVKNWHLQDKFSRCTFLPDIASVVELSERKQVFIAGGKKVYGQFLDLPQTGAMHLTTVFADCHSRSVFDFHRQDWKKIKEDSHPQNPQNHHPMMFETLIRV